MRVGEGRGNEARELAEGGEGLVDLPEDSTMALQSPVELLKPSESKSPQMEPRPESIFNVPTCASSSQGLSHTKSRGRTGAGLCFRRVKVPAVLGTDKAGGQVGAGRWGWAQ